MNIKSILVLVGLIIFCLTLSFAVGFIGLPAYISYPITIALCLVVGIVGGNYV